MTTETRRLLDSETARPIVTYLDDTIRKSRDTQTRVKALWDKTGEVSTEDAWAVKIARMQGRAAYVAVTILQEHGPYFDATKEAMKAGA